MIYLFISNLHPIIISFPLYPPVQSVVCAGTLLQVAAWESAQPPAGGGGDGLGSIFDDPAAFGGDIASVVSRASPGASASQPSSPIKASTSSAVPDADEDNDNDNEDEGAAS